MWTGATTIDSGAEECEQQTRLDLGSDRESEELEDSAGTARSRDSWSDHSGGQYPGSFHETNA